MADIYKSREWLAFMRKIQANLNDDVVRLTAADFLEEHGEFKRAAFIRKQIHSPAIDWASDFTACYYNGDTIEKWDLGELVNTPIKLLTTEGGNFYSIFLWYKRGFLTSVVCNLRDWIGGVCKTCNGHKIVIITSEARAVECEDCKFAGAIYGRGPDVVKFGAVEKLTLLDLEPEEIGDSWCWSKSSLPELFKFLPGYINYRRGRSISRLGYATKENALEAAGSAGIKWALKRAFTKSKSVRR